LQQREQFILKKLAEAREAQASAMKRFTLARARVMEVEARLRAVQARSAATLARWEEVTPMSVAASFGSESVPDTPAPTLLNEVLSEMPISMYDLTQVPLTPEASALIDEAGLGALARALAGEFAPDQAKQDIPAVLPAESADSTDDEEATAQLVVQPPTQTDQLPELEGEPAGSTDDEEAIAQPAVQPPTQTDQLPELEEEETLLTSMSVLIEARRARKATAREQEARQGAEIPPAGEESATDDITTKIPVIRQERLKPQEPA
jgi:hypothetical protein